MICDILCKSIPTIMGALVGFGSSYMLNRFNHKKEIERALLNKKLEIYADAISYVRMCAKIDEHKGEEQYRDERKKEVEEASVLYDEFYPVFSMIVSNKKKDKYDQLLKNIVKCHMSQAKAYEECIKILDYNVSK